jgi:23S rRNA pseudouridine2605 synthase
MKKTNNFEKFLPKKKNSVIKEEIRQQKKKFKKERQDQMEHKKIAKREQTTLITKNQSPKGDKTARTAPVITRKAVEQMPLNKYIAHCGVCGRREAVTLIKEGKVKVNNVVITEPGFKIKEADDVKIAGKKIFLAHNLVKGATNERVYPIGRLDRNTTGVLLITNDGELTQKLSHPSNEVRKMYEVKLDKPLTKLHFDKILAGITLEDGLVIVDALAFADPKDKSIIGIEIHSGKNRIVRRIFEAMGYDVKGLDRVMFANLTKKNVDRGKWRFLKDKEVRLLKFMNTSFIRKNKNVKEESE